MHEEQDVEPVEDWKVPVAQLMQLEVEAIEYVPVLQDEQVVDDVVA